MIAALIALATALLCRKRSSLARISIVLLSIGFIVFNGLAIFDNPAFTRIVSWKNVLVLGSLQPFALGVLIGAAWHEIRGRLGRRIILILLGVSVCFWQSYGYLLRETPTTYDRWKGNVCRQSTQATCSAAAAVNLLKTIGIDATETEIVRLCFTSDIGTTKLGLYRGLCVKTEGTRGSLAPLPERVEDLHKYCPALISVRIDPGQHVDPKYERDWGWVPGVSHSIVLLRFRDDGKIDIIDPSVGLEQWDANALRDLWKGKGFYLDPRK